MIKISCIIPAYNAERTIVKCLDSIFSQTNEIEVVLVNDGSKDLTDIVVNDYITNNPNYNLKYIVTENGGVSKARNIGLANASGEYIAFVDSDDYVLPKYFESLYDNMNNYDLTVFSYSTNLGEDCQDINSNMVGEYNVEDFMKLIISVSKTSIMGYIWRCLFKKSVIVDNKLQFHPNIKMSEDYLFLCQYVGCLSGKIKITDEKIYYYWINENSATGKYMPALKESMESVNDIIGESVIAQNAALLDNYYDCLSNTFLQITQNIMKKGSPLTVISGYKYLKEVEPKYKKYLVSSYKRKKNLRTNLALFMCFYKFKMLWLYLVLYKFKLKF